MNCTGYMVFLASLHVGGGVCASGKLALADISTRSTSGPFSAGRAVVPPAGICGVPGLRNSSFRFSSNRSEIGQASRQQLCRVACQISGRQDQHTRLISRLSGPPGFVAVGFLAAQLTGALHNLLEYILEYTHTHIYIYIYTYICVCEYIYIYVYMQIILMTLVIIL